jgi:hypothetical protein
VRLTTGGLTVRLLLLALLLTACDPDPEDENAEICASQLEGDPTATLGQLVQGVFEPLKPGDELPVHAGSQGGYHSDYALLLSGEDADRSVEYGLLTTADTGEWTEQVNSSLAPRCERFGDAGWYNLSATFWSGPGCGDDPCAEAPDDENEACFDYDRCVENFDEGYPNISREELVGYDVSIEVSPFVEDLELSARVEQIELVMGGTVSDGGG